ncbi:flagellar export chaperone FliS [Caldalkalibacillus salinus]|uniref:flagellar export chaperone FliS n=1 Tax=Caldalkalibacillus salinus TaxID=2803787 RepID=UPI001923598D|nr:flagellar export chaperone FliS [Caldalkalibacillus salinus]
MSINNPYQTYQQNAMNTASPGDLTLMLYNGCLKFIKQGRQAMIEERYQDKNTNMIKAQKIIEELMVTLNTDMEISQSMMQLYDYLNQRLIEANLNNDTAILNEVEDFVVQFRDTWKEALKVNRQQQYGTGTPSQG